MGMNIGIFRHGKSKYRQGRATLEEACDLTKEGEYHVNSTAYEFANFNKWVDNAIIFSSPYGRALHTAKIISRVLKNRFFIDTKKIEIDEDLSEVKNFDWGLFSPLINGGYVELNGQNFFINSYESNPKATPHQIYFMHDIYRMLPEELKRKLPKEYIGALESFESFSDVKKRMRRFLQNISNLDEKLIISVTHEALVYHILDNFSFGQNQSLEPGDYIHIKKKDDGLYVYNDRITLGGYGNSLTNILRL